MAYIVQSGDSLWAVAKTTLADGSRWKEIQAINNIDGTNIHAGQILTIPGDPVPAPGGDEGTAERFTPEQIFKLSVRAGFTPSEAVTMTAIALAESGGRPAALNPNGEYSQGLWQINADYHKRHIPEGADPYNPGVNAFLARVVYMRVGGGSISPWTVSHIDKGIRYARYKEQALQAAVDAGYVGVKGWWGGAPGYGSSVSASWDGVLSSTPAILVPYVAGAPEVLEVPEVSPVVEVPPVVDVPPVVEVPLVADVPPVVDDSTRLADMVAGIGLDTQEDFKQAFMVLAREAIKIR